MSATELIVNEYPDSIEEIVTAAMPNLSDKALIYFRDNKLVFLGTPDERDAGINAEGRGVYFAPHAAQMPFFMTDSKKVMVRLLAGGNGSGKSLAGEWESAVRATFKIHPITKEVLKQPSKGRIIVTSSKLIDTNLIPRLKKWIPKEVLIGGATLEADYNTCWDNSYSKEHCVLKLNNGSTIDFMNYDQDSEKFEAVERDWIWADEELPEPIYNACLLRLRTGGIIYITVTMLHRSVWMEERLLDQEDSDSSIKCFTMKGKENPYVSEECLSKILRKFAAGERRAREDGVPLFQEGRTYPVFDQLIHCIPRSQIPAKDTLTIYQGCDPHPSIETYFVWAGASGDGNVYVYDIQKRREVIPRLCSMLKGIEEWKGGEDPIYDRRIDPVIGNTKAEVGSQVSIKQEFRKHDICFQDGTKQKDIRIEKLSELLDYDKDQPISQFNHPKLYIADDLFELMTDLKRQSWHTIKDPKRWHSLDCLEWIACASPAYHDKALTAEIRNVQRIERDYI